MSDGAANWIKTNPGKGWFPYFRFYAPQQAYFRQDLAAQRHRIGEVIR
jgi:hypothetical protein